MRILIKNTPTAGRRPTGRDLRVYAVDDEGRNPVPMRGVRAVSIACDGRGGTVIATLAIDALIDVEAELPAAPAAAADESVSDGVPRRTSIGEDTTDVQSPHARRAGVELGPVLPKLKLATCEPNHHVFDGPNAMLCKCGEYLRGDGARSIVKAPPGGG